MFKFCLDGIVKVGRSGQIVMKRTEEEKLTARSVKHRSLMAQAMEALLGMGFTSAEAQTALEHHEGDLTDVGEVVRYALKRLGANA